MLLNTFDTVLSFAAVMLVLSLFVTACVQLVSALLLLRNGSLTWGLKQLFAQLGLDKQKAAALVKEVMNMPALRTASTWSFGGRAEAIKPGELVNALREIAVRQTAPSELKQLSGIAAAGSTSLPGSDAEATASGAADSLTAKLAAIDAELSKLFPQQALAAREAVARAVNAGDKLAANVNAWFDTVMSRASDRFALMTRYWTVAISLILVLYMGVDATHIYTTLKKDDALRAAWVAQVPALLEDAEKMLGEKDCSAVAQRALEQRVAAADTNEAVDKAITAALPKPPAKPLIGLADGRALLEKAGQSDQVKPFDSAYDDLAKKCFGDALAELKKRSESLEKVDPLLIEYTKSSGKNWWEKLLPWGEKFPVGNLPGMLLAWVLLSLGAPFWFNILKSLSSLRPLIAERSDKAATKP